MTANGYELPWDVVLGLQLVCVQQDLDAYSKL
jgi:hypothetical protein